MGTRNPNLVIQKDLWGIPTWFQISQIQLYFWFELWTWWSSLEFWHKFLSILFHRFANIALKKMIDFRFSVVELSKFNYMDWDSIVYKLVYLTMLGSNAQLNQFFTSYFMKKL